MPGASNAAAKEKRIAGEVDDGKELRLLLQGNGGKPGLNRGVR